jgi:hypothetical protein
MNVDWPLHGYRCPPNAVACARLPQARKSRANHTQMATLEEKPIGVATTSGFYGLDDTEQGSQLAI